MASDWSAAVYRFTAPAASAYNLTVSTGGTRAVDSCGFGNNPVSVQTTKLSTLTASSGIRTVIPGSYSASSNVKTWRSTVTLAAGDFVEIEVSKLASPNRFELSLCI